MELEDELAQLRSIQEMKNEHTEMGNDAGATNKHRTSRKKQNTETT